jgi:hypothetical protein
MEMLIEMAMEQQLPLSLDANDEMDLVVACGFRSVWCFFCPSPFSGGYDAQYK